MSVSSMKKLSVLTPKGDADAVVRRLMRLRCVEISRADASSELLACNYDTEVANAEERVKRISEALPLLTKHTRRKSSLRRRLIKTQAESFVATGSYSTAWSVVDEVLEIKTAMARLSDEEKKTCENITALLPWKNLDFPLDFGGTDTTVHTLGTVPSAVDIGAMNNALEEHFATLGVISENSSSKYVSILYHKSGEDGVNRIFAEYGFVKAAFSIGDTANAELERLRALIPTYDIRLQRYVDRLVQLAVLLDDVEILYDMEETAKIAAENMQKLAATELCVLVEGWVPADRETVVATALSKLDCAYEMKEPDGDDVPPVLLKNNGYATNFEWVVGMYSYPKYGSYDPTFVMSIFYFIIFGLMFADVGYGLILTLAGLILPRALGFKPGLKRMFNMFGYCGISSMVMGVLFGGWFGDLPYAIMENMMGMENARETVPFFNGLLFNPLDDPIAFLIVSLGMGVVHLVAGMAVKFYLLAKEGKWFDAIFDIASWWFIFGGIGVLLLVGTLPGAITIGIGVLMIVFAAGREAKNPILRFLKGLLGLYDITSYASDLLSYCRILALGLAAGVISQVVNLIGTMGGATVGGFIALILSFLIGHGLNLAINILGTFVHTSRLQYLEFFNKFYEDGGREFKPEEPSSKYSTAECDIYGEDA